MVQVKDLTELTLVERWSEVKDDEEWWDEIKPRTLSAVKVLMEEAMEVELLEQLDAGQVSADGVQARLPQRAPVQGTAD